MDATRTSTSSRAGLAGTGRSRCAWRGSGGCCSPVLKLVSGLFFCDRMVTRRPGQPGAPRPRRAAAPAFGSESVLHSCPTERRPDGNVTPEKRRSWREDGASLPPAQREPRVSSWGWCGRQEAVLGRGWGEGAPAGAPGKTGDTHLVDLIGRSWGRGLEGRPVAGIWGGEAGRPGEQFAETRQILQ